MNTSSRSLLHSAKTDQELDHASCLLIGRYGVLLRGESGSGKSQLRRYIARQCHQKGVFTALVSDDYVHLIAPKGSSALIAVAPEATFTKQEVRGIGICSLEDEERYEKFVRLHLVVDLIRPDDMERMPRAQNTHICLLNRTIQKLEVPRRDCITASDIIFARLSTFHP